MIQMYNTTYINHYAQSTCKEQTKYRIAQMTQPTIFLELNRCLHFSTHFKNDLRQEMKIMPNLSTLKYMYKV